VIALLLLLACGTGDSDEALPLQYRVVRGDTLFLIARAHDVTVDQLREWNGLSGDLIEVDQVLAIYTDAVMPPAAVVTPRRRSKKPAPQPVEGGRSDLVMPLEQACLAGPHDVQGEQEMAASEGLSSASARMAIGGFVHQTLRCMPDAFAPTAPLTLELNVACTGRVSAVTVADGGDWPGDVVVCVREVLGFTPFPAHGLPDGEVVRYPLRYTPP
jgi:LysM repeat protein